jgi:hypothetical protein
MVNLIARSSAEQTPVELSRSLRIGASVGRHDHALARFALLDVRRVAQQTLEQSRGEREGRRIRALFGYFSLSA